jgi:hypothetical protein
MQDTQRDELTDRPRRVPIPLGHGPGAEEMRFICHMRSVSAEGFVTAPSRQNGPGTLPSAVPKSSELAGLPPGFDPETINWSVLSARSRAILQLVATPMVAGRSLAEVATSLQAEGISGDGEADVELEHLGERA